jgi:hypothetical protein
MKHYRSPSQESALIFLFFEGYADRPWQAGTQFNLDCLQYARRHRAGRMFQVL